MIDFKKALEEYNLSARIQEDHEIAENMIDPRECSYSQFVSLLCKPMGNLTNDLLHCAIGMSGELGEYIRAVEEERTGVVNPDESVEIELGDFLFYNVGAFALLFEQPVERTAQSWLTEVAIDLLAKDNSIIGLSLDRKFVVAVADFLDQVKKCWVYNRKPDKKLLGEYLARVMHYIYYLHKTHDTDPYTLAISNRAKLLKRYKDGKYSDAAAIAREDKTAPQE